MSYELTYFDDPGTYLPSTAVSWVTNAGESIHTCCMYIHLYWCLASLSLSFSPSLHSSCPRFPQEDTPGSSQEEQVVTSTPPAVQAVTMTPVSPYNPLPQLNLITSSHTTSRVLSVCYYPSPRATHGSSPPILNILSTGSTSISVISTLNYLSLLLCS